MPRLIEAEELKHILNNSKYYGTKAGNAFADMITECQTINERSTGRLIDSEELIHELSKSKVMMVVDVGGNCNYIRESDVFKIFGSAPAIGEGKKGKWELFIQCSACGYKRKWNGEIFGFCPKCGAEMEDENNGK